MQVLLDPGYSCRVFLENALDGIHFTVESSGPWNAGVCTGDWRVPTVGDWQQETPLVTGCGVPGVLQWGHGADSGRCPWTCVAGAVLYFTCLVLAASDCTSNADLLEINLVQFLCLYG